MNKKLLVSLFLFLFAFSFMLLSQEEPKEERKGEDERISITVDKVERADSFPEELRSPHYTYLPPKKGRDLVVVYITVVEKKDLKIGMTGLRLKRPKSPHLIDDQGMTHWGRTFQFFTTSRPKITGYLIYDIPKEVTTLVHLKYVYQYREEPPKPQEIKFGRVDVNLTHIQ